MEITKGENANLAGMEPRCPKCKAPASIYWMLGHHEGKCNGVDCEYGSVNWREFFRSPAPTPPLDVEAEKRIAEIRERESKATKGPWFWRKCYEIGRRHWAIKSPESEADGRVVGVMGTLAFDDFTPPDKWHDDPNNQFIAHARLDIPFLLEQISLLRRHIASPAPQLKLKIQELVGLPVDREIEDDLVFSAVKALHHAVGLCQHSHWGVSVTHWPPLPAPPQSGKEGQS